MTRNEAHLRYLETVIGQMVLPPAIGLRRPPAEALDDIAAKADELLGRGMVQH